MKNTVLLIFSFLSLKSFAQPCGGEYPSGMYHNNKFVNPNRDTLNKVDKSGFYEGLHVYTDNLENIYNDTTDYTIGLYSHGEPLGFWEAHCKDGTFSVGHFCMGSGESTSDGKGGWIEKKQGIYNKIGVWQYFDKNKHLIKTERYDRSFNWHGWYDKKYLKDSTGKFILIRDEFKNKATIFSSFNHHIIKEYSPNGLPISYEIYSFWRSLSYEFYPDGKIKTIKKRNVFLGKRLKASVTKEYNTKGQVKCKTKVKCKHPDVFIKPICDF